MGLKMKKWINYAKRCLKVTGLAILLGAILSFPLKTLAIDNFRGEELFIQHCSGCHVKGGNIIRRGKTLKLSTLKRNGIDNPEAIAEIARKGIGIMSGYEEILSKDEDKLIAKWIWKQAQNAWTQG